MCLKTLLLLDWLSKLQYKIKKVFQLSFTKFAKKGEEEVGVKVKGVEWRANANIRWVQFFKHFFVTLWEEKETTEKRLAC